MSEDYTIKPTNPDTISFNNHGKAFLVVRPDGTVEIPEGVTMDEAARVFWQAIEGYGPKKEIERLTTDLAAERERVSYLERSIIAADKLLRKEAENVAKLREALEPFSTLLQSDTEDSSDEIEEWVDVTIGDLRRARAVLADKKESGDE
jgi:hypothetical protein